MTTSSRSVIRKLTFVLFAAAAVAGFQGCGARLYSNAEVRKRAVFVFPPVYDTIIAPLNDQLIPIYKRTFFIKQDI
ncbi:MAG: hypothetical protein MUF22_05500, partial [Chitinispirillaceae bacterium]|nr:hypothetical protein [Chitinispirillaceae bacterium]